jgi:O-antigen/teichoic acid export membrane protein
MSASSTAVTNHQPLSVQAFWLTFSKLVAALLNIGLPILLVRLMSQVEYGVFKQAFLFTGTATNMAAMGLGMSAFYFMPRHPERGGQIAFNILIYNLVAGWVPLVVLSFYPQVLRLLFRTNELVPLAFLLGILVFLTLTASMVQTIPTALQDVRYSTIFIVGTQLARAIMMAGAVLVFHTVKSLIVAAILSQLLSVIVLYWYLNDRFPRFWTHFEWQSFREQLAYAIPYGAVGIIWVIQKDLDNYFVSATLGPRDYAIYAVGWLEIPLISLFLESVVQVLIIRVSRLQHEGRKDEILRITAAATGQLAAIQLPLYMLLLVAGHDLIVLLYTKAYEPSAKIFAVTITLLIFTLFLVDPIVRAYADLRNFVLGVKIAAFVTLICVLVPVIHHFGMMGAAVVAVVIQVMERLATGWAAARAVNAKLKDLALYRDSFKIAGLTAAAGLFAYAIRNLIRPALLVPRILAVGICFSLLYVPVFYALRLPGWDLMSKERIQSMIRNQLSRMKKATALPVV